MIKQILRLHLQGKGKKTISRITGASKNTVRKYLDLSGDDPNTTEEILKLDDTAVEGLLPDHSQKEESSTKRKVFEEELEYFKKEINERGVSRMQLWLEYLQRHPDGYKYSQFCEHLKDHLRSPDISIPREYEPGEIAFMDFAGKSLPILDPSTGELQPTETFVACLGFSQYGFVRSVESQRTEDVVESIVKCWEYFGGVPQGFMPDNMKTAVVKTDRYEPTINRVLQDLANHYGTTVVPARARKPKDKSLAETLVRHTYDHIFAPLRDRTFYSLKEQNQAYLEQLARYNKRGFQKKDHSRQYLFDQHERKTLAPLPRERFEIRKYRDVKVRNNCHVELSEDKHYYSVPMKYIGEKVRVIYTKKIVTVYHNTQQIACHKREKGKHKYTSTAHHLPSWWGQYHDRDVKRYLKWAGDISEKLTKVIDRIINSRPHPEQSYRSCEGVQSLDRRYGRKKLLRACEMALAMDQCSYTFLRNVIENGMVDEESDHQQQTSLKLPDHDNIRGGDHYQ